MYSREFMLYFVSEFHLEDYWLGRVRYWSLRIPSTSTVLRFRSFSSVVDFVLTNYVDDRCAFRRFLRDYSRRKSFVCDYDAMLRECSKVLKANYKNL